jgi:L-ascorbate metabolism protein UlaG (beta-lactamase superfamily)
MFTLRYLGTAGWHIQTDDASMVIDPYFTRVPLWRVLFTRLIPNETLIARHTPPAEAIFVTHAHYDHLMDVPEAAHLTRAMVYGSPQTLQIAQQLGLPYKQFQIIRPGETKCIGKCEIDVYFSVHRRIFGRVPAHGAPLYDSHPPLRAEEYRMDMLYSLRARCGGMSVLIASGLEREPAVEADVLLYGADATDAQLGRVLEATKPRLVMPNHWDNMFRPLHRPTRPMIMPPPTWRPILRRIDVKNFAKRVERIRPGTQVIVPELFAEYRLDEMLSGG